MPQAGWSVSINPSKLWLLIRCLRKAKVKAHLWKLTCLSIHAFLPSMWAHIKWGNCYKHIFPHRWSSPWVPIRCEQDPHSMRNMLGLARLDEPSVPSIVALSIVTHKNLDFLTCNSSNELSMLQCAIATQSVGIVSSHSADMGGK